MTAPDREIRSGGTFRVVLVRDSSPRFEMSELNMSAKFPSRRLLTLVNDDQSTTNRVQNYLSFLKFYKRDENGDTQLHILIENYPSYKIVIEKLIKMTLHPAMLNRRNKNKATALHLAAMKSFPAIVRHLIMAGANPFNKDKNGWIPLHYACRTGHIAVVHALTLPLLPEEIQAMGRFVRTPQLLSSLLIRNSEGLIPLDIARREGHADVEECLFNLAQHLDSTKPHSGSSFFARFPRL